MFRFFIRGHSIHSRIHQGGLEDPETFEDKTNWKRILKNLSHRCQVTDLEPPVNSQPSHWLGGARRVISRWKIVWARKDIFFKTNGHHFLKTLKTYAIFFKQSIRLIFTVSKNAEERISNLKTYFMIDHEKFEKLRNHENEIFRKSYGSPFLSQSILKWGWSTHSKIPQGVAEPPKTV